MSNVFKNIYTKFLYSSHHNNRDLLMNRLPNDRNYIYLHEYSIKRIQSYLYYLQDQARQISLLSIA